MQAISKEATTWTCDSCGEPIEEVGHGWVEWLTYINENNYFQRGFRLVHHCTAHEPLDTRCQYREPLEWQRNSPIVSDLPLERFLGPDGLILLLSFIAQGTLPFEEVLEMIKRLHVPGYEEARFHFEDAISEGIIEPRTGRGYYWMSDIEAVLENLRTA